MKKSDSVKLYPLALVVLFAVVIYTPLIGGFFQQDEILSTVENRNLAQFAGLPRTLLDTVDFPSDFTTH